MGDSCEVRCIHPEAVANARRLLESGDTYRELRQAAREILPGARIRHLLMGRYLLTWVRPPIL